MDFKKRIKMHKYVAISYIILGPALILLAHLTKSSNTFLYAFGFALLIMGIVRMIAHRRLNKDEKTMRQREVTETDERNRMISERAKSWVFSFTVMMAGIATIVLSVLGYHEQAQPFAWFVCLIVALYWIFWLIANKKY